MKKVFAWMVRIACFAVIGLAIFTVVRSFLHRNDDHSREALLGTTAVTSVDEAAYQSAEEELIAAAEAQSVEEDPTAVLYDNGDITITANGKQITFPKAEVALCRLRIEF